MRTAARTDDSPLNRTAHTAHSAHHARTHVSDDSAGFSLSSLAALSPSPSNVGSPSSVLRLPILSLCSLVLSAMSPFLQRGVCRGNCVDSLDRTNAALVLPGQVRTRLSTTRPVTHSFTSRRQLWRHRLRPARHVRTNGRRHRTTIRRQSNAPSSAQRPEQHQHTTAHPAAATQTRPCLSSSLLSHSSRLTSRPSCSLASCVTTITAFRTSASRTLSICFWVCIGRGRGVSRVVNCGTCRVTTTCTYDSSE